MICSMNKDRTNLHELVTHIAAFDEAEQEAQAWAAGWIASGAPLYREDAPDVPYEHLVTYGAVIDPLHRSILLGDHKKSGLWLPPGGHVNAGESPGEAVRRELAEELGSAALRSLTFAATPLFLTVRPVYLPRKHVDVSLWYVAAGAEDMPLQLDPSEFYGSRWFGFDELAELDHRKTDPEMGRFMDKLELVLRS